MKFSLTILGSSAAVPTASRNTTAHVLNAHERFYLIDCGEGTQLQIRRNRIPLGNIQQVFISHLHSDHLLGIYGYLSTLSLLGRKAALNLYGPADLENIISGHFSRVPDTLLFPLNFTALTETGLKLIHEDKAVEVWSFPVRHRTPTWGFFFREKTRTPEGHSAYGRSYAYCSDTLFDPGLSRFFMGCDLLYHEATYSEAHRKRAFSTTHSTAAQAGEMARLCKAGQLIIGHFSARYKDVSVLLEEARTVFPDSLAAEDGMIIDIQPGMKD